MFTHPDFEPIIISVGPLDLHWYGLMYLLAFASAWLMAMHQAKQDDAPIAKARVDSLVTYGAFGAIFGGRIGYLAFYNFDVWMNDPLLLFWVWKGGMSFHGGLVGVAFAVFFYAHRIHVSYLKLTDFVAPLVPIGLGFGRLGNFIGQELWGRPTDVPWSVVFPKDLELLSRHPSQLYQMLAEGVVLFFLIFWFAKKPRPLGAVSGVFLVAYSVLRFVVEFLREPDGHVGFDLYGWVTRGQLLSVPMLLLGLGLLLVVYRQAKKDQVLLKEREEK